MKWMGSMHIAFYCYCVDEDADVYAVDFHVRFAEEELQGSTLISLCFLHLADAFNAADETATFDLNYALEEEMLDGSNDPEHVEQG